MEFSSKCKTPLRILFLGEVFGLCFRLGNLWASYGSQQNVSIVRKLVHTRTYQLQHQNVV